jgi:hypothetical protein
MAETPQLTPEPRLPFFWASTRKTSPLTWYRLRTITISAVRFFTANLHVTDSSGCGRRFVLLQIKIRDGAHRSTY